MAHSSRTGANGEGQQRAGYAPFARLFESGRYFAQSGSGSIAAVQTAVGYDADLLTLMFAVSSSRRKNALLARERFRMAATEQGRRHDHQSDG
jgi:hypothetical protein